MIGLDEKLEELAEKSAQKAVEEYCRRHPEKRQMEKLMLTTAEAAELLGIGRKACERLCRDGQLPAFQVPGLQGWRMRRCELEAWVEEKRNAETAA